MEEIFNSTGVTVILDLMSPLSNVHPYSVSVTVVPSDHSVSDFMITNNTHAELTLPYNMRYNVSFISTFCGLNDESSTIQLFYSEQSDFMI